MALSFKQRISDYPDLAELDGVAAVPEFNPVLIGKPTFSGEVQEPTYVPPILQFAAPQVIPNRQAVIPGEAPALAYMPEPPPAPLPILLPSSQIESQPQVSVVATVPGATEMPKKFFQKLGSVLSGAAQGFAQGGPGGAIAGGIGGAIAGRVAQMGVERLASRPRTCPEGSVPVLGQCVNLPFGRVRGGGMTLSYGEAVTARYGAALVPASETRTYRRCPKGAVLADDGYCYNRGDITRKQRMWNPGRKPLLTGGDLNAISRAFRAASRLKTQQRRLEKLGMMKKKTTNGRNGSRGIITKAEAAKALRA